MEVPEVGNEGPWNDAVPDGQEVTSIVTVKDGEVDVLLRPSIAPEMAEWNKFVRSVPGLMVAIVHGEPPFEELKGKFRDDEKVLVKEMWSEIKAEELLSYEWLLSLLGTRPTGEGTSLSHNPETGAAQTAKMLSIGDRSSAGFIPEQTPHASLATWRPVSNIGGDKSLSLVNTGLQHSTLISSRKRPRHKETSQGAGSGSENSECEQNTSKTPTKRKRSVSLGERSIHLDTARGGSEESETHTVHTSIRGMDRGRCFEDGASEASKRSKS